MIGHAIGPINVACTHALTSSYMSVCPNVYKNAGTHICRPISVHASMHTSVHTPMHISIHDSTQAPGATLTAVTAAPASWLILAVAIFIAKVFAAVHTLTGLHTCLYVCICTCPDVHECTCRYTPAFGISAVMTTLPAATVSEISSVKQFDCFAMSLLIRPSIVSSYSAIEPAIVSFTAFKDSWDGFSKSARPTQG